MSFEEHDPDYDAPGSGWSELEPPESARCFIANIWVDATVTAFRGDGSVRVIWPPGTEHHRELEAGYHQFPVPV